MGVDFNQISEECFYQLVEQFSLLIGLMFVDHEQLLH